MTVKIVFKNNRFYCRTSFDDRIYPQAAKWIFDSKNKFYYTDNYERAFSLSEYMDQDLKNLTYKLLIHTGLWGGTLALPPDGLTLLKHQPPAVFFALNQNKSYLGCDPGLGKTIIQAMIASCLEGIVVVIVPPFLQLNTQAEFEKWAPKLVVKTINEVNLGDSGFDVLIVPDSLLTDKGVTAYIEYLVRNSHYNTLFIDEAHRFKNEEAKRTQALYGIEGTTKRKAVQGIVDLNFDKIVLYSGTPMPNRPMELYTPVNKLAPQCIDYMTREDFGKEYCAGYHDGHGWNFSGASNVKTLASKIIAPSGKFMLRQRKALLNLPPKIEETIVLGGGHSVKLFKVDMALMAKYSPEDIIKGQIAKRLGRAEEDLHVATYRRLLGLEKVPYAVEYIESLMEETDENILVFCIHKEVVAALKEGLAKYRPLVIDGSVPTGKRQAIVDEFQDKKKGRRIWIGNIAAGGVGYTLTKANRVLMVEFEYTPGGNDQAGDRAHRYGVLWSVLVQFLVLKNSMDRKIIETLLRKRKATQYI